MASIPFHIPSIPKPQDTYNFLIDNSNSLFLHPSLPKSPDGLGRPIHPAEAYDPVSFAHYHLPASLGPIKPPLMESTPFKLVDDVAGLHYLATKLALAPEFAVDLEHNGYRSFQGLTCLMQISTRTEDFVVDTLKVRASVGEFLGKFFLDPSKKKVMHGAINDIIWLQRDFGIYVVNLFDTMQASRVMRLERNSLAFLLKYFCGVDANKEYQCSDWRLRPLPSDMVKYAREDTHYLLYIYDVMRKELVSGSKQLGFEDPLGEVCKRSHEVCLRMYKKEVFDKETSYLFMHGLGDADNLDAKQLAIVAGLFEWRDRVAREEDESTGYILPNKQLLEIAKKKPLKARELLDLVGYSRTLVLRDVDQIVEILWAAICVHAPNFEKVAKDLNSGVPISEIGAKIQEMKKMDQEHEKKLAFIDHQQESEASKRKGMALLALLPQPSTPVNQLCRRRLPIRRPPLTDTTVTISPSFKLSWLSVEKM
ncbi:hypothetical protein Cgig2_034041 [Carnegiea gigantea]|uniref:HRDC domain-containing protein n=1 Tax=Carnegiea gigantea TaxID=171969 RepID=A0A9Q1JII3_9CARY|nr:hypothetical protein Cgig2_034041 [Carnegiea gigantea]